MSDRDEYVAKIEAVVIMLSNMQGWHGFKLASVLNTIDPKTGEILPLPPLKGNDPIPYSNRMYMHSSIKRWKIVNCIHAQYYTGTDVDRIIALVSNNGGRILSCRDVLEMDCETNEANIRIDV